jgi:hypothetical protein|tara:strand:- start:109 stop:459 length:351 start_codon:yes stop_codon:yes gene_type:complete
MTPELNTRLKTDYEAPEGHLATKLESLSEEQIATLLEDPKARAAVQPLLTQDQVHTGDRRLAGAVEELHKAGLLLGYGLPENNPNPSGIGLYYVFAPYFNREELVPAMKEFLAQFE